MTKKDFKGTWQARVLAATHSPTGEPSQFGAILDCALNSEAQQGVKKAMEDNDGDHYLHVSRPYFVGRASVTSDGFLMCDFVTRDGAYHSGALAGRYDDDLRLNEVAIARHLKLSPDEWGALVKALLVWISSDWRVK